MRFEAILGRSWAVLGRSWGDLEATWVDFGSFWGVIRGALLLFFYWFLMFFSKSRFSHEPHVNREYICLLECVKRACLSVLGRSWDDLEAILEPLGAPRVPKNSAGHSEPQQLDRGDCGPSAQPLPP